MGRYSPVSWRERQGWRSPFWVLGLVGMVYAVFLVVRPGRAGPRIKPRARTQSEIRLDDEDWRTAGADPESLGEQVRRIVANPAAALLLMRLRGGEFRGGDVSDLAADVHLRAVRSGAGQLVVHIDVLAARQSAGGDLRRDRGRPGSRGGREGAGSACRALGLIAGCAVRLLDGMVDVGAAS